MPPFDTFPAGPIPVELADMPTLERMVLSENSLSGEWRYLKNNVPPKGLSGEKLRTHRRNAGLLGGGHRNAGLFGEGHS